MTPQLKKRIGIGLLIAVAGGVGAGWIWSTSRPSGPGDGFVSGNGRIEATEIDIATKLAGRVQDILVNEGDFVRVGQALAQMQIEVLDAQRDEARAQSGQAVTAVASAEAQVAARQSDTTAVQALVGQRESELDAAQRRLARSEKLSKSGAMALQELDDNRAGVQGAAAAVAAARAQVSAAQAAVKAAQAQVIGTQSGVAASEATIARVEADIQDSLLKSPRDGRVQYRIAQPGEVLAGGGKVLNLVDLGDVYMTFFLPETAVGKVALGSEVRIVLDAAPQYVIPAQVSFVASTAQFTPKTVETASERQKLMFRVKAQLNRELLEKHLALVKTGLPGVAWLKLDAHASWPANLEIKVPE
jgi:HlyD family secretion protein